MADQSAQDLVQQGLAHHQKEELEAALSALRKSAYREERLEEELQAALNALQESGYRVYHLANKIENEAAMRARFQRRPAYQRALKKGGRYDFGPQEQ